MQNDHLIQGDRRPAGSFPSSLLRRSGSRPSSRPVSARDRVPARGRVGIKTLHFSGRMHIALSAASETKIFDGKVFKEGMKSGFF